MTDAQLFAEVRAFLAQWRTAGLATVDEQGRAHAANVQFVADADLNLYFISSPQSAHGRHIALDPRIALTIYGHVADNSGPSQIHGLQLHGECYGLVDAKDRARAIDLYLKRFDFIAKSESLLARVKAEQMYHFRPTWLRWIDNRRGFGFKVEKTLAV